MNIKKQKTQKKCFFEDYKHCLEATQLENRMNHLEKYKIDVDGLKEDHKEFIQNNKLMLKTQQRFRVERNNVFAEEINKIALSASYDKSIQSIDSIETYAYGIRKDLVL